MPGSVWLRGFVTGVVLAIMFLASRQIVVILDLIRDPAGFAAIAYPEEKLDPGSSGMRE